jgi:hypothetical protein
MKVKPSTNICVDVKMDRVDPVVKSQACHVKAYDYYDPGKIECQLKWAKGINPLLFTFIWNVFYWQKRVDECKVKFIGTIKKIPAHYILK